MFQIELIGDTGVLARLDAFPAAVHRRVLAVVREQSLRLVAYIQTQKLQGQVLRHVTGKLSASINQEVTDNPTSVIGRIFSNGTVRYAAVHEFGFDGIEAVRGYERRQTMVFGRPIDPITVSVAAFDRHMHMPERSFMRSALAELTPQIEDALAQAATGAWEEGAP